MRTTLQILVTVGVLAGCKSNDNWTYKHLPWKTGDQLSADEVYSALKVGIENAGKGTIERDGSRIIIRTTKENCDSLIGMEDSVPNGGEIWCKDGMDLVWVLSRK